MKEHLNAMSYAKPEPSPVAEVQRRDCSQKGEVTPTPDPRPTLSMKINLRTHNSQAGRCF